MPLEALRRSVRRARYGKPIVVVSGLPRSGTSMMMQMLHAGGVEPVQDGVRTPDEDNPKGYYELEVVKDMEGAADMTWLHQARGKAVKIIAFLMQHLPPTHNYKVVFMNRSLEEVLASQTKMLDRLGTADNAEDARMRELYVNHLARTKSMLTYRPHFDVHHVRYDSVVSDAQAHAQKLNAFLGGGLDVEAMAAAVSPDLYRNRR